MESKDSEKSGAENNTATASSLNPAWLALVSAVFGSVCSAIVAYFVANKDMETQKLVFDSKLIELSVGVLKDDPRLKQWAIRIIELRSNTEFTDDAKRRLEQAGPLDGSAPTTERNKSVPRFGETDGFYGEDLGYADTSYSYSYTPDYPVHEQEKLKKAVTNYNKAVKEMK